MRVSVDSIPTKRNPKPVYAKFGDLRNIGWSSLSLPLLRSSGGQKQLGLNHLLLVEINLGVELN